jgi:hypothetical protein
LVSRPSAPQCQIVAARKDVLFKESMPVTMNCGTEIRRASCQLSSPIDKSTHLSLLLRPREDKQYLAASGNAGTERAWSIWLDSEEAAASSMASTASAYCSGTGRNTSCRLRSTNADTSDITNFYTCRADITICPDNWSSVNITNRHKTAVCYAKRGDRNRLRLDG